MAQRNNTLATQTTHVSGNDSLLVLALSWDLLTIRQILNIAICIFLVRVADSSLHISTCWDAPIWFGTPMPAPILTCQRHRKIQYFRYQLHSFSHGGLPTQLLVPRRSLAQWVHTQSALQILRYWGIGISIGREEVGSVQPWLPVCVCTIWLHCSSIRKTKMNHARRMWRAAATAQRCRVSVSKQISLGNKGPLFSHVHLAFVSPPTLMFQR